MRLSRDEVEAIVSVIGASVNKRYAALYLYGSRADDTKKGGDIDLLLVFENDADKQAARHHLIDLLIGIKDLIGEQKVDLLLATQEEMQQDPFLCRISKEVVMLKKW